VLNFLPFIPLGETSVNFCPDSFRNPTETSTGVLSGEVTNTNFILWFDLIRALTHDIQHSRQAILLIVALNTINLSLDNHEIMNLLYK
jgi:hypothetical protein